jgi:DNA-binding transcriptional regulator YdaS (Cro superfamily)
MDLIRARRGLMAQIARDLGLTRSAVATWARVPAERVPEVARITGLLKHEIRPDLFDAPGAPEAR